MSEHPDPVRLLDDPDEAELLRLALRAGRDELPDDDAVARIERRVLLAIAVPTGGGGGAGGAGGALPSSMALTTAGLGLGAIGVVALAVVALRGAPTSPSPPRAPVVVATEVADAGAERDGGVVVVALPPRLDPASLPAVAEAGGRARRRGPTDEVAETEAAEGETWPTSPTTETVAEPPAAPSEAALLLAGTRALRRHDAAEALALAERCAALHPSGSQAQEREMLAIEALVALRREAEARSRAESFRSRWPGSSHVRRLDVLLPP